MTDQPKASDLVAEARSHASAMIKTPLSRDCAYSADIIRRLADEVERLSTPYCLGQTTIQTVAREGQLALDSGHAFIAASDLYKQDPYEQLNQARAREARYRTCLETISEREWPNGALLEFVGRALGGDERK